MNHLKYLNSYFWKYKYHLLLGIFFVAAGNYFRAWQPQVIREALDFVLQQLKAYQSTTDIIARQNILDTLSPALLKFGGIVVILALVMGVFMYFMRQTIIVMSRLIEYDLRKVLYDKYQSLDKGFYKKNATGDMMARITEDVNKVRMYLGPALLYGINLVTLFIMVIYAMLKVDVRLTLYTLIPLPILSISIFYVSQFIEKRSTAIQTKLSKLTAITQEVFSGIRVVKSYTQEKAFNQYFSEETEEYRKKNMSMALVEAMFIPLMMVLIGISTIIVIYVGGLEVFKGSITTGNIAEFVIYVNMLTWPVTSIGWIASMVQQANVSQGRINEFLLAEPTITNIAHSKPEVKGLIEFKDVSFTYPDTGIEALKKVSFRISPGEKVAVIGRTASGKSTLADLMLRMYDPTSGEILLDGVPLREYDLAYLRDQIAYVPQDVFLFSDTLDANIRFGYPDANPQQVESAARHAVIWDEVQSLPDGIETRIGERGITLSGGQKQRISMARALIKSPEIVILDDSLSAVDTHTEHTIIGYLNKELADKTALIITHRVMGMFAYDRILVLDHGKLAESGSHDTLLQSRGLYYDLWTRHQMMASVETDTELPEK